MSPARVVQDKLTRAFHDIPFREPEGMAIQLARAGDVSHPRLCFGFASGNEAGRRLASIAYKDRLV